ncbi:MAG: hypothetical protein F6K39_47350, partial [Okeania sp. SIO3B3]|nr:hypothetical protein [Okeania sp. SIO3B3]
YGLGVPPLGEGLGWLIASFFLLISVLTWWARSWFLAEQLGMGKHIFWAFGSAIWLFQSSQTRSIKSGPGRCSESLGIPVA